VKGQANISSDGRTITVRIPLSFRKRGGRKLVVVPDGSAWATSRARIDNALVAALARAHRWKRMLESGEFASVIELAHAEKINESYLCRILRLTLLAPDIIETILDGRQSTALQLNLLMAPTPITWSEQRRRITAGVP